MMAGSEAGERHDWTVTGMDCAACASKITTALERLPGVADVQVGVMSERLSLRLEPGATGREVVEAVVKKLGYGIAPKGQSTGKRKFVVPGGPAAPAADDHAGHDHAGHDRSRNHDGRAHPTGPALHGGHRSLACAHFSAPSLSSCCCLPHPRSPLLHGMAGRIRARFTS